MSRSPRNPLDPATGEADYRAKVSECIKVSSWFAYSLRSGEDTPFRFSEDVLDRYSKAVAELVVMVQEEGTVMPVARRSQVDPDFQRFMGRVVASASGGSSSR